MRSLLLHSYRGEEELCWNKKMNKTYKTCLIVIGSSNFDNQCHQ